MLKEPFRRYAAVTDPSRSMDPLAPIQDSEERRAALKSFEEYRASFGCAFVVQVHSLNMMIDLPDCFHGNRICMGYVGNEGGDSYDLPFLAYLERLHRKRLASLAALDSSKGGFSKINDGEPRTLH